MPAKQVKRRSAKPTTDEEKAASLITSRPKPAKSYGWIKWVVGALFIAGIVVMFVVMHITNSTIATGISQTLNK